MEEAIKKFGKHYTTKVVNNLENPPEVIDEIVKAITKAVETPRNTIYVFGNGGSYGIAKHFQLSMKRIYEDTEIESRKPSLKIDTAFDFHEGQQSALKHGFNELFARRLYEQGANGDDLVICISGSGNSDNLIRAIEYSRETGIPTMAFAGNFGGKMGEIVDLSHLVQDTDQQLSEDVIQGILHTIAERVRNKVYGVRNNEKYETLRDIQRIQGLCALEPSFLDELSAKVVDAYYKGKTVYLLGPEGDGMSISAEHTAHNLNWDAVYQVKNPPKRKIVSTATSCDYSGIGNDRLNKGIVTAQQMVNANKDDILITFAHDIESCAVQDTLAKANEAGIQRYTIFGTGDSNESDTCKLWTVNPFYSADVMQVFGHMLGRIVRAKIQLRNGVDIGDPAEYLINNDLAQRRLLHDRYK
jgi:D-sedoheptulose 7-phosphate isomerase